MTTVATKPRCRHCGSSFILLDEDGKPYCLLCRRPYQDFRDYGRMGGLRTVELYGREWMSELGRRGGRPHQKTLAELRQQAVPKAQIQVREGMAAQPNNLRVLKELYRLQQRSRPENNGNGGSSAVEVQASPREEGI